MAMSLVVQAGAAALVGAVFVGGVNASLHAPPETGGLCVIKGNISISTGRRIYHVPGQDYYDATRIDPAYGERWFCSEAEALQAGWVRARR